MDRNERNPWWNATLLELENACAKHAIALGERVQRTAAERTAMAADIRYLLIALGNRIGTGDTIPDSPEMEMTRGVVPDLVVSFMRFYARIAHTAEREARRETLMRAADYVLGGGAARWIDPLEGALPERPAYKALDSDDGLRECLGDLAALLKANGRKR